MGNVSYRFFTALFSGFLFIIVLINYVGWSGAWINVGMSGHVDWTNSYFGFESFMKMINYIKLPQDGFFSLKSMLKHFEDFIEVCSFGIPRFVESILSKSFSLDDLFHFLLDIILQPFMLIYDLFVIIAHLFYYVNVISQAIILAMSGYFNIPMADLPSTTITTPVQSVVNVDFVAFGYLPV